MKLLKILTLLATFTTHLIIPAAPIAKNDTAKTTPKQIAKQPKKILIPPHTPPAKIAAQQEAKTTEPKLVTPKTSVTPVSATPVAPVAPVAPLVQTPTAKHTIPPTAPKQSVQVPSVQVPYLQELQKAGMAQPILTAWTALYQQCQTAQNNTQPFAVTAQTEPLFNTDFFAMMVQHLDPKTFAPLTNDPLGTIHTSYATVHLRQAMQRFSDICKINIDPTSKQPSIHFTSDVRDLGILVNLQNNTDAQFAVYQKSIDGTQSTQIGLIQPGMNALDFYTAALQNNATPTPKNNSNSTTLPDEVATKTGQYFQLQELNAVSPVTIDLKIMTGTEVIAFLKTLYRDPQALKKDIFEMNGLPTSPEFITNPNDWYLLLIQNPTPSTASERDPQQRIQAINITKFTAPYLLTAQINQENVEITPATHNNAAVYVDVYQPSIQTALIPQNKTFKMDQVPLLILSDFLWKIPAMRALWMLQTTAHLSILTHAKFFDSKSFGDAFEYFNGIGCFDKENKYLFIIDKYNILKVGESFYDASWLIGTGVYDTIMPSCSDIPQILSSQNSFGQITTNNFKNFHYINFQLIINFDNPIILNKSNFLTSGFNTLYTKLTDQKHIMINAKTDELSDNIFVNFVLIDLNQYRLTFTNKKNNLIAQHTLYVSNSIQDIQLNFIDLTPTNNIGASISSKIVSDLNKKESNQIPEIKIMYAYNAQEDKHILLPEVSTPIDKLDAVMNVNFLKYPLTTLYYEFYQTYNVHPYNKYYIINNNEVPEPLSALTENDWVKGIYFVPSINDSKLLISFYNANKTKLGDMVLDNQHRQTTPITSLSYNLKGADILPIIYMYGTTGVFLRYNGLKKSFK